MGHQELTVKFCQPLPYAGIFSDYGTGKTLMALLLAEVKKYKKILVVSTKTSIDSTWADEIRLHTDFRFCILTGTVKHKINMMEYALSQIDDPRRYGSESSVRPMIVLMNYESVKSMYYELQRAGFDAVFADESTKIKSIDAERTKALIEVGRFISHRYILTGFPVTEALHELYAQIKFIDQGATFGHSYYAFLNKYFVRMGPKIILKKKSIKEIMEKIKPFCIRITNKTLKLPPAIHKPMMIEQTPEQKELFAQLEETFRLEFGKVKFDTKYIFALLAKSLQICDGFVQNIEKDEETGKEISHELEIIPTNKDEVLVEALDQINVAKNKVVIWCAHLFAVDKLKRILAKLGINVLTLTGATENVNKTVQMFQKTRDYNVLICTLKKGAESVTLTEARYAIYYSNVWSYDQRGNSEARIRRKGSEKHSSIIYIDLVTKDSVEKKVYDCLMKKKDLINELKTAFLGMEGK
jgi:SNF2 family DNA or RNA helicase